MLFVYYIHAYAEDEVYDLRKDIAVKANVIVSILMAILEEYFLSIDTMTQKHVVIQLYQRSAWSLLAIWNASWIAKYLSLLL